MEILWFGPVTSASGYGLHNRKIIDGLVKLGVKVKLEYPKKREDYLRSFYPQYWELRNTKLSDPKKAIMIACTPPVAGAFHTSYLILYTTLETATVHPGFVNRCKFFDEVWVPCAQNYKVLRKKLPKKIPLYVMPEGVDGEKYNTSLSSTSWEYDGSFVFFFQSDWSYRKGVQWLIPAFAEEFSEQEKVLLLIHTRYQGQTGSDQSARVMLEFTDLMESVRNTRPGRVYVNTALLTDEEQINLYKNCDCYVLPSMGEGWSLTVIQAMACGKPVITTAYGGHRHFCTHKNSYLVKVKKLDTIDQNTNLEVDFYKGQKFAYPSVKDLRKKMRFVYDHYDQAILKGRQALSDVREKWTWENASKKVYDRLSVIEEKLQDDEKYGRLQERRRESYRGL